MPISEAETRIEHGLFEQPTVSAMFEASAERHLTASAQQYKGGVYDRSLVKERVVAAAPDGAYATLTYGELRQIVRRLTAGFREIGVGVDDRVSLISTTRMEWAQVDFAVLAAGGVVSTVYPSVSGRRLQALVADTDPVGVVVENTDLLARLLETDVSHRLDFVIVIDSLAGDETVVETARERVAVYTLGELYERGKQVFDLDAYNAWIESREPTALASLVSTSGTTGESKAVRLSHRNFQENITQTVRRFGPRPDRPASVPTLDYHTKTLSFLPLSHVFERLVGHFLMIAMGATIAYAESPQTLQSDFQQVSPSCSTGVPRVYEKLYRAVEAKASNTNVGGHLFNWAVEVGKAFHAADTPGRGLRVQHAVADFLVFSQVREGLGGNIEFFISGGASLSAELCGLYHGMGLPIFEGYGLTETAPVVSVNPPENPIVGTIGPPLTGVETRLDQTTETVAAKNGGEVGELLVRGPNVTNGYWRNPDATREAFVSLSEAKVESEADNKMSASGNPWFRTGDIVERRSDGYLVFRERTKDLLVLSTGKSVAPSPIERAFERDPAIEQCLVVGDDEKFVSALIVIDTERLRRWASRNGTALPESAEAVTADDRVRTRIQQTVERVNSELEPHEQVVRFSLLTELFSVENELLTPTMKKRRQQIVDQYVDHVERLYSANEGYSAESNDHAD